MVFRILVRVLAVAPFVFFACKPGQMSRSTSNQEMAARQDSIARMDSIRIADSLAVVQRKIDSLAWEKNAVAIDAYRLLKDTVTLIGVGDIMMGTNFPSEQYLPGENLLKPVNSILQDADVTFGNHEGVILNEGGDPKRCSDPDLCYIFRTPISYAPYLTEAGFDVMSLANNHAGDFGQPGRESSMKTLDSLGIYHAGQLQRPYVTFEQDGMRYGFAAFSPNTGTVSINDLDGAIDIIKHLDSISDIVIVSFHGGAEGNKYEHITREREYFYGENRGNVYEFAHTLIDNGADVIFGHGPHVTRAVEVYNDRFIAYSLGNFLTYGRFNLRGVNGIAPIVKVFTDGNGKFYKAKVTSIIQRGAGGPVVDTQDRAWKKLKELTQEDFPEVPLYFEEGGVITYIKQ
ncbi:CapA family protein [Roseivirga sp. BDSF3-8]|uniref:CapA family protein n=1 Tax=Roseivirga sp. BDSF3-8 TaxID=3241598 RepID=UPI0035322112